MKRFLNSCLILIAFVFSLSFIKPTFAGDWVADGNKWKYMENGSFVTASWVETSDGIYYLDIEGHMATELIKIGKFYHMFNENGKPYSRSQDFFYNNVSYAIGSRGKVMDLEAVMNDTDYFKYIIDLRAKRAEEAAKKATEMQFSSPDQVASENPVIAETEELTEQQKRLLAAEEYKKVEAEKAAAAALAEKYKILSKENRDALAAASLVGNDEASATLSLMTEYNRQTDIIKSGIIDAVKLILQTNPNALSIEGVLEDYNKTIKEYTSELDTCLVTIRNRLGMDNTHFVLMKEKFTQVLKLEADSLRAKIMGIL